MLLVCDARSTPGSTHPPVPVKRHRGRRDTRTHGSHRRTSQPSLTTIPTHNRTQARPRDDRRARSRPNLGRDARIATNQKPPHTTHPKKTGGSRVTSTGKKTGGTGEPGHTHNSSKSARKPNRLSYLQEIFRRSVKLPKTPINSNAQDANAVASLRRGSSIGLEAS